MRPLYKAVLEREASPPPASALSVPRAATLSPAAALAAGGSTRATVTAAPATVQLSSQHLPLPVQHLLDQWLGRPVGARYDVVQLCAALGSGGGSGGAGGGGGNLATDKQRFVMVEPKWARAGEALGPSGAGDGSAQDGVVRVVQHGEGGAVTQWLDGVCFYVNAGRDYKGSAARDSNRFWHDTAGVPSGKFGCLVSRTRTPTQCPTTEWRLLVVPQVRWS